MQFTGDKRSLLMVVLVTKLFEVFGFISYYSTWFLYLTIWTNAMSLALSLVSMSSKVMVYDYLYHSTRDNTQRSWCYMYVCVLLRKKKQFEMLLNGAYHIPFYESSSTLGLLEGRFNNSIHLWSNWSSSLNKNHWITPKFKPLLTLVACCIYLCYMKISAFCHFWGFSRTQHSSVFTIIFFLHHSSR